MPEVMETDMLICDIHLSEGSRPLLRFGIGIDRLSIRTGKEESGGSALDRARWVSRIVRSGSPSGMIRQPAREFGLVQHIPFAISKCSSTREPDSLYATRSMTQ